MVLYRRWNFLMKLYPASWLPLKPLWLYKPPSLFLVAPSSWGCTKTCFDVGIFSLAQCVRVPQLVSGFISEIFLLCVAVDSVCPWEEGEFKRLLCCHLGLGSLKVQVMLPDAVCPIFHVMWYSFLVGSLNLGTYIFLFWKLLPFVLSGL